MGIQARGIIVYVVIGLVAFVGGFIAGSSYMANICGDFAIKFLGVFDVTINKELLLQYLARFHG